MVADSNPVLSHISIKPGVRGGQPCLRNTRVTVWEVLRWLAAGASQDEILQDYPYLESDDFKAVFAYAAAMGSERQLADAQANGVSLPDYVRDFILDHYREDVEDSQAAEARLNNPQPPIGIHQLRQNLGLDN